MTPDSRQLLKLIGKIFLVWALLSAFGALYGKQIINPALPLMQGFAQNITDDFYVNLAWQKQNTGMLMIEANFGIPKTSIRALGINPGASISAGTNIEHILVPLVLLFTLVICWPAKRWKHRGILLLLSIPAAVASLLLTTPFLLVGKVEGLLQDQATQIGIVRDKPAYLDWMLFTEVGGRWLVPICLGLFCVWLQNSLFPSKEPAPENE
ncbi:MAG: hypothetical protein ACU84Q_21895 [Gammaproteobacteria bacterium]